MDERSRFVMETQRRKDKRREEEEEEVRETRRTDERTDRRDCPRVGVSRRRRGALI